MDLPTLPLQKYALVLPPDKFNVHWPQLLSWFLKGLIIPKFTNTLIGVGHIYDAECTVLFTKQDVTAFLPTDEPILRGWRKKVMPKLRRFDLRPSKNVFPQPKPNTKHATFSAFSAYYLPSVDALVRYLHAAAGLLIKSTWLKPQKQVIFLPGLV